MSRLPFMSLLRTRAFRIALWWVIAIAIVAFGAWDDDDEIERSDTPPQVLVQGGLGINSIKPAEVYAGSAVIARYQGLADDAEAPLVVRVGGREAQILHASDDQLVIEIPSDLEPGSTTIELVQGERRSQVHMLRVKALRARKILRSLVGGLALFVFGLRTLSRGLRGYAGQPMRAALARWTRGRARGLAFGVVTGGVGQSMLSVAAFVAGLLESRLLTFGAALVVLLGAHVGAGTAILILPLGISREALWIVALGVAWITLARNRRAESAGELILGLGLLFYGLSVLRSGFQPLMGDPDVLPYLEALRGDDATGLWARLGAGALLGGLLQGPGAAFGLVLSIGESTALLSPRQGLEILAATNIGASLGTFLLALPFGRGAKRLAVGHLCVAIPCTLLFLLLVTPSLALSELALGTDPAQLDYGKKILLPNFAPHLALSYVAAQVLAVVLVTSFTPQIANAVLRLMPWRERTKTHVSPKRPTIVDEPIDRVSATLVRSLECDRRMMEATLALLAHGTRSEAATGDEQIASVRAEIKQAIEELASHSEEGVHRAMAVCVAVLNLQRALEQLLQQAERGIEKNYTLDESSREAFASLHQQVVDSLEHALEHLRGHQGLDIEQVRGREITVNATEAEQRQHQLMGLSEVPGDEHAVLWRIEVLGAYEHVGNHVYRIGEVLVEGIEDDF